MNAAPSRMRRLQNGSSEQKAHENIDLSLRSLNLTLILLCVRAQTTKTKTTSDNHMRRQTHDTKIFYSIRNITWRNLFSFQIVTYVDTIRNISMFLAALCNVDRRIHLIKFGSFLHWKISSRDPLLHSYQILLEATLQRKLHGKLDSRYYPALLSYSISRCWKKFLNVLTCCPHEHTCRYGPIICSIGRQSWDLSIKLLLAGSTNQNLLASKTEQLTRWRILIWSVHSSPYMPACCVAIILYCQKSKKSVSAQLVWF